MNKWSSIWLEQRVCYGRVFVGRRGEEMKPRCLQAPGGVRQSDLHWKLLPAVEGTDWSRDLQQGQCTSPGDRGPWPRSWVFSSF